ncbi:MAG: FtsX-like permease family protein [Pseudomonadota bacterium]|nr:FtsX-like permease family protein [Pseudomonadota bacterium]
MSLRGFLWALAALASHWRRRPLLLAAALLGLAAATALWIGVQALNAEARRSYDAASRAVSVAALPSLEAAGGGPVDAARFGPLRQAGWPVSPVVDASVEVGPAAAPPRRLRLLGVEPVTLPAAAGLALLDGQGGEAGAEADGPPAPDFATFARPPGRTLISAATLAELGARPGDRLDTARGPTPPLAISAATAPGTLVMDIGFAQPLAGLEGRATRFLLDPEAETPAATPAPPPGLRRVEARPSVDPGQLTESFHLNLTAFGLLAFVVGLFIAHGAVGLAFEQRRGLMRSLRACGLPAWTLCAALGAELLVLALVAGACGVLGGALVARALLPDVAASLRGLYDAPAPDALSLPASWWLWGLAMSVAGAAVASGGALWKAARLPVLDSARPEAWFAAARRARARQGAAAGALAVASAALAVWGEGLVAGFAMIGAMLGAAALALPGALGLALAALQARADRRWGPLAGWMAADARQQLPGLSLALMALMIALAANVGVGSMVDGFRLTFESWLDDRLAAEVYAEADPGAEARLAALIAADPRIAADLPEFRADTVLAGAPVELRGFADHPTWRARWPLLSAAPGAWDRVAAGEGAMISEQLARRLGLGLGDALALPGGPALPVAAIFADYGNPRGQARLSNAALAARVPDAARGRHALRVDPPGAAGAVAAALDAAEGVRAQEQGSIRRLSSVIFERTFAVTGALNALTFGVAGLALATSLLSLSAARLPQTAPVWAMGTSRRRLAAMEMGRIMGLALLTAVLATPLGVALAWALVAVVNVAAFGWRLPLHVFPADWARLAAMAVAAAGLAAAIPLAGFLRTSPAALAKVFADER